MKVLENNISQVKVYKTQYGTYNICSFYKHNNSLKLTTTEFRS